MNHTLGLILSTIFTNLIVFLAVTFSPYLSPSGIFFGIRLENQYKKTTEIRKITKTYLYQCTGAFITITLLTSWLLYTGTNKRWINFMMISSIFLLLGICFALFVKAHHQIKDFAVQLNSSSEEMTKAVIDTDLMKAKNKLRKHFRCLYIVPALITGLTIIYTLLCYNHLPDQIPTHWNILGVADGWQAKTPLNIGIQSLIQIFLVGALCYICDQIFTTRGRLDQDNYEYSKQSFMLYLKRMGYSFYTMILSTQVLFIFTTFSMIHSTSIHMAVIICSLIVPLGTTIYMFIVWFRYRKNTQTYSSYAPESSNHHWIWGTLYYNPDDPSTFVEKRYGIGWTINLATPLGKSIMIATLLLIAISILFPVFTS